MEPTTEAVEIEIPAVVYEDIGEFCLDCGRAVDEGTEWFATRRPEVRLSTYDETKGMRGFLCENCQPLEGTLIEPLIDALAARRWDRDMVKSRMRAVGVENLYEAIVGPSLDLLEVVLRLER